MLAFSEGVLLAEKSGIARKTAVDVFTHSAITSPMVRIADRSCSACPTKPGST